MFRTPAGSPASISTSARFCTETGTSEAGLNTTVLPATSAGASFQVGIAIGKFHGVISPTTPERLLDGVEVRVRHARRELLAADPPALAAEEAQDVDRALHLAGRLGERLAFLGA